MKNLIKARNLLVRRGIWCRDMCMVLYAMMEEGYGYAEALQAYADYEFVSRAEMERRLEESCRRAGIWTGARYTLEECYRRGLYED